MSANEIGEHSPTVANDESTCLTGELIRNGEKINWECWATRLAILPSQAAKLAHCIDPINWPDNEFAQGPIPEELQRKIQRLEEWLSDRFDSMPLIDLIHSLGPESVPYRMKQACPVAEPPTPKLAKTTEDGRYTLENAAEIIAKEEDEDKEEILKRLIDAASNGVIPMYNPGSNLDLIYQGDKQARWFYEEAYWNDLNVWLSRTRLAYRFPEPLSDRNDATPSEERDQKTSHRRDQEERDQKKSVLQDQAILEWFSSHEEDPLSIPPYKMGARNLKGEVRNDMLKKRTLFTKKSFDICWERLRKARKLRNQ